MLEEGTAWQAESFEQLRQRVGQSQCINQLRLLPVRKGAAGRFPGPSRGFVSHLQQVPLKLQAPDVSATCLSLQFKLISFGAWCCSAATFSADVIILASHFDAQQHF